MNREFGYDKSSFSRPKSSKNHLGHLREGDIMAISGSDSESGNDMEKIKTARLKRMRERDRIGFGDSSGPSNTDPVRKPRDSASLKGVSGYSSSIRALGFSDLSFEDDEDLDLPPPPMSRRSGDTFNLDADPIAHRFSDGSAPVFVGSEDDVVDLEAEQPLPKSGTGFTALPIPPLADVMATFKAKIASKKAEISDAQDLRDQTAERIRVLQEELGAVKARIETARRRYESLDNQATLA